MRVNDIREALRVRPGYWFAPKLFGWGATPVTWQGWAIVIGYAVAIMAVARLLPGVPAKLIVGSLLTASLLYVCWRKTDGGWHWHWSLKR